MGKHFNLDSLHVLLRKDIDDTNKVIHLYNLSRELSNRNTDSSIILGNQSLQLAQKLNWKAGEAYSYIVLGWCDELQGNLPEALTKYFKAVHLAENIHNKLILSIALGVTGDIYSEQGDYTKAMNYYFRSLKMDKELNNKWGIARNLGLIGSVYKKQQNYPAALDYYFGALRMCEELGNINGKAVWSSYIGSVYKQTGDFDKALDYCLKSLKMFEDLGNKNHIAEDLYNIGSIYASKGNYKESSDYLYHSLALSGKIGALHHVQNSYEALSSLYEKSTIPLPDSIGGKLLTTEQMRLKALYYHKCYLNVRDKLFSNQKQKQIMNIEFGRKEDAIRFEQEKKDINQQYIRNIITASLFTALFFLVVVFRQRNKISKEKSRSDELLSNILPTEVAEELKEKGSAEAKQFDEVTVLFTDFMAFTQLSEKLSAKELVTKINDYFSAFDQIMKDHGVEKIKTIGDSYMAAGGIPIPNKTHALDVVKAALAIKHFMLEYMEKKKAAGELFFEIRMGIHTGQVVAGIVGTKKFAYDIWGDTVNMASRMESNGEVGKVNISTTTYELIKHKYNCTYRGKIQAKGKGGIDMYFIDGEI